MPGNPALKRKPEDQSGREAQVQEDDELAKADDPPEQHVLPQLPSIRPLTTALRDRGVDAVDGVPAFSQPTSCSVPSCVLQGGHPGSHEDESGNQLVLNSQYGRALVEAADVPVAESSSSSGSDSEELMPDVKPGESGGPQINSMEAADPPGNVLRPGVGD